MFWHVNLVWFLHVICLFRAMQGEKSYKGAEWTCKFSFWQLVVHRKVAICLSHCAFPQNIHPGVNSLSQIFSHPGFAFSMSLSQSILGLHCPWRINAMLSQNFAKIRYLIPFGSAVSTVYYKCAYINSILGTNYLLFRSLLLLSSSHT